MLERAIGIARGQARHQTDVTFYAYHHCQAEWAVMPEPEFNISNPQNIGVIYTQGSANSILLSTVDPREKCLYSQDLQDDSWQMSGLTFSIVDCLFRWVPPVNLSEVLLRIRREYWALQMTRMTISCPRESLLDFSKCGPQPTHRESKDPANESQGPYLT